MADAEEQPTIGFSPGTLAIQYIYQQSTHSNKCLRIHLCADDLRLATQAPTFEEVETRLSAALEPMGQYYDKWSLNPNPFKTQVCAFHLRNRESNRKLKILWYGKELEHHQFPVYLGVTLDGTLIVTALARVLCICVEQIIAC